MTREPTSSNIIITAPAIKTIISNRKRDIPIPHCNVWPRQLGDRLPEAVWWVSRRIISNCAVFGNVSRRTAQIRNQHRQSQWTGADKPAVDPNHRVKKGGRRTWGAATGWMVLGNCDERGKGRRRRESHFRWRSCRAARKEEERASGSVDQRSASLYPSPTFAS